MTDLLWYFALGVSIILNLILWHEMRAAQKQADAFWKQLKTQHHQPFSVGPRTVGMPRGSDGK